MLCSCIEDFLINDARDTFERMSFNHLPHGIPAWAWVLPLSIQVLSDQVWAQTREPLRSSPAERQYLEGKGAIRPCADCALFEANDYGLNRAQIEGGITS